MLADTFTKIYCTINPAKVKAQGTENNSISEGKFLSVPLDLESFIWKISSN